MQMGVHSARLNGSGASIEMTLLELVHLFVEDGCSEQEIVAVVLKLLGNGDVTLIGNFRGERLDGGE